MSRKLFTALASATAAFAIIGCSGQDEPLFDPEQADEIVEAAILEVEDLPGDGWVEVTSSDDDDDSDFLDYDSAACAELSKRADDIGAKLPGIDESTEEVANAAVEFERPYETVAASVEADIGVYESNGVAAEMITGIEELIGDELLGGAGMTDALADELETDEVEGFEIEYRFEEVPAVGRVPGDNGVSKGFDFTVAVALVGERVEMSMNMNMYFWHLGNGVAYAFVATSEGDLADRDVEEIITTINAKLRDQATR